jgi:hypothetical protein
MGHVPHVGPPLLEGSLERYAERPDLVELRPADATLPKSATLRLASQVPTQFSVVSQSRVSSRPELTKRWSVALDVAREVEARCLVLATPFGHPHRLNRKRLKALVDGSPDAPLLVAGSRAGCGDRGGHCARSGPGSRSWWTPRGSGSQGPIAYFRLRGLGESTRPARRDRQSGRRACGSLSSRGKRTTSPAPRAQALRKSSAPAARGGDRCRPRRDVPGRR